MVAALKSRHLDRNTVIILSAKHGQSPQTPSALTRIPDSPILSGLDAAWNAAGHTGGLVAFSINDDNMLIWLKDRSQDAADFAKTYLLTHPGIGNDINASPKTLPASGLQTVYAGEAAANFLHITPGDARVPDLIGIVQYGVVSSGGQGKIAEHGGNNPQDRGVPLLVSGVPVQDRGISETSVETTQIAPTILALLGLDPNALQAVQIEHTRSLLSAGDQGGGNGGGGNQGGNGGNGGGNGGNN